MLVHGLERFFDDMTVIEQPFLGTRNDAGFLKIGQYGLINMLEATLELFYGQWPDGSCSGAQAALTEPFKAVFQLRNE